MRFHLNDKINIPVKHQKSCQHFYVKVLFRVEFIRTFLSSECFTYDILSSLKRSVSSRPWPSSIMWLQEILTNDLPGEGGHHRGNEPILLKFGKNLILSK